MTTPIVLSGEIAPGTNGGFFQTTVFPDLNNAGEVAFYSTLTGGSAIHGIFLGDGLTTRSVAVLGQTAPGTGGGTYASLFSPPRINDNGQIAFSAVMSGGAALTGIFFETDGVVSPVALAGDPAPGTGSTYLNFSTTFVSLNNLGEVAAVNGVTGIPPTVGIFVESASGGSLVVLRGDPVPGLPASVFDTFGKPSINDLGQVAFEANLIGPTSGRGVFLYTNGFGVVVALEGGVAPGTGGGVFTDFDIDSSGLDNDGNVYFLGRMMGPGPNRGLFVGNGLTNSAIVHEDDGLPYPGGATVDSLNDPPQTSPNGLFAFGSVLDLPGTQNARAVYVGVADVPGVILAASDEIPVIAVGGGTVGGAATGLGSVNDFGDIAYISALTLGGTSALGIFVPEPQMLVGLGVGVLALLIGRGHRTRIKSA